MSFTSLFIIWCLLLGHAKKVEIIVQLLIKIVDLLLGLYYNCKVHGFPCTEHVTAMFGGREREMSRTVVRKNESLEDALRRFKRTVSKTELYKKLESANIMKSQA